MGQVNQTLGIYLKDFSRNFTLFKFISERRISVLKATKICPVNFFELFFDIQYVIALRVLAKTTRNDGWLWRQLVVL